MPIQQPLDEAFSALAKQVVDDHGTFTSADNCRAVADLQGKRLAGAILEYMTEPYRQLLDLETKQTVESGAPVTPEAEKLSAQFAPAFTRLARRLAAVIAESPNAACLRVSCATLVHEAISEVLMATPVFTAAN